MKFRYAEGTAHFTRSVNKTEYQQFIEKFPKGKKYSYIIFCDASGKLTSIESSNLEIKEHAKKLGLT
tara:strand:- start:590 stop:790 length:201 start_codon:yes stop_codon:yes gene_type:complete